ncbi:hypothetical protein E2C01_004281 [Portunus trituberculatus]|uniref:Uncharacterized protein n=1 Tax=Portunus trituberculatus TaxID=210409 RepID=A0A5B7CS00_PORTR|nr:hypothetical protein [Portunus trituberculatus]
MEGHLVLTLWRPFNTTLKATASVSIARGHYRFVLVTEPPKLPTIPALPPICTEERQLGPQQAILKPPVPLRSPTSPCHTPPPRQRQASLTQPSDDRGGITSR